VASFSAANNSSMPGYTGPETTPHVHICDISETPVNVDATRGDYSSRSSGGSGAYRGTPILNACASSLQATKIYKPYNVMINVNKTKDIELRAADFARMSLSGIGPSDEL
jgi:hypothetical protein